MKTSIAGFINGKLVTGKNLKVKYVNAGNLYLDPIRKKITIKNMDIEIGWELHDIVRKEGSYKSMDYEEREKAIRKLFAQWFREKLS
jgi:hypothetical protein